MIRKQLEVNRVVEHSPFNESERIGELIAFHQERASFWSRCAEKARTALSRTKRNAYAVTHASMAKALEFELNDNQ